MSRIQERARLDGIDITQCGGHPRSGLVDIDPVVEIQPVGEGELVEQQILRGLLTTFGCAVVTRIVAVQVLVQSLHDVGERVDVLDHRLLTQEPGEVLEIRQVLGIAYATTGLCRQRVLDRVHAEVFERLVGLAAELDTVVEILGPLVVEIDGRNERGQDHRRAAHDDQ